MASQTDICNLALLKLGEETIMDLNENSKSATVCRLFYADTRDSLLRSHPWNFAIKRVQLAKLLTTPVYGYDSEFQLPSDCLRVMYTDLLAGNEFRIEGKKLLANTDSINIEYVSRVEDTTQFDALFVDALWTLLASRIAYNISDNNTLSQSLKEMSDASILQAKSINGQEGIPYPIQADEWLNVRI